MDNGINDLKGAMRNAVGDLHSVSVILAILSLMMKFLIPRHSAKERKATSSFSVI